MWLRYTFVFESAFIQLPKAKRDRLMLAPSISRIPRLFVFEAHSDPAKSINDNFPYQTSAFIPRSLSRYSTVTCKTAWDQDECWLASVGSWVQRWDPKCNRFITSLVEEAMISVTPTMKMPWEASSQISSPCPFSVGVSESKSQITSL